MHASAEYAGQANFELCGRTALRKRDIRITALACVYFTTLSRTYTRTLLEKFWQISLFVTVAKLYVE